MHGTAPLINIPGRPDGSFQLREKRTGGGPPWDSIIKGGTEITFDKTTLRFSFQKEDGCRWRWDKSYMPYMECRSGNIFFHDAGEITHELLSHRGGRRDIKHLLWI